MFPHQRISRSRRKHLQIEVRELNREELLRIARPILFNTEMVQAIMREENPKTVTRRILKGYVPKDAIFGYTMFTPEKHISCRGTFLDGYGEKFFKLPYLKNDILYVRETWSTHYSGNSNGRLAYCYKADGINLKSECMPGETNRWYPSIHMPKEAARIFLKIRDVRVERLRDMKLDDFLSEGVTLRLEAFNDPENAYWQARRIFESIWNNTIKKSDLMFHSWDANPYIWVVEFEYLKNI